ncbi:MAG: adenosylhomocysteinase, partial [Sulfolobales archaeon]
GSRILGGTEETTTGVIRLKAMERDRVLLYPVIAVNNAQTKYLFDNRYGTGQSTVDGLLRATNILIAGKTAVVAGYGWVGKGIAMRLRGMGARVVVVEVDPIKALEAYMDGYMVTSMSKAAEIGDIFITATGNKDVIRREHMLRMKDGAILANAGHFNVEISIRDLEDISIEKRVIRENLTEYKLRDGRRIYLLAEGRLVNLVAAEGHPSEVMDMSFANQALSVEYIYRNSEKLEKRVYNVPEDIDRLVAELKLEALGVEIERLTEEQIRYLSQWTEGT